MAKSANNLNAVLQDTADAIRSKTGSNGLITPRDFADEIDSIQVGIVPSGALAITSNGQYNVSTYAQANVAVVPSGILLDYPAANTIVDATGNPKTPKDAVNDMFQWLYVASDWSPNAMNMVQVLFSNSAEDEYFMMKFGGNDSECVFELYSSGTNGDGTNGILLYRIHIPNGKYFKIPYWFNGGDSLKIITINKGLWYNNKAYLTSAY